MKKFLSVLLTLTLVVGMLSAFTVSAAVNTTTFYNAATNEVITSLDDVTSIYATTTFTGRYENNASVIVPHYDFDGKLIKVESIVPVESTIGASVSYTTPEISVTDTDIVKLFVWTGVETIKPLLKFPGVISRSIPLPTATTTKLDVATITDVPLTFAMNFKADPVTKAQLLAYGDWYADYELKINKDVTFNLNGTKDAYLAGQYDSWSPAWVTVPKKEITLLADTPLKIMETGAELYGEPGLKYTCIEVFDRVKDFDCGVFFSEEFLAANPDIYVTLELRIYNPLDESESYLINSETYEFGTRPSVDKFVGKDVTLTHTLETVEGGKLTVSLADLFDAVGPEIYSETVTVTVDGATVNNVAEDWTQTTVDFTTPGEYTVAVTDNNYCKVATATVTVAAPASVDKWTATDKAITLTVDTVGVDQTVDFAELFTAVDGAIIKTADVTVTDGTYADGVITVPGKAGTYTVTVTDNFYCNTATATIVVNDAASVDKFVGKDIEVAHTLATIESGKYTVDFADLFDTTGYEVKEITVTGGTYADGKVTVEGLGTITVTATDNFYCNVATATITVNEPASVDKWTATNKTIDLTVDTVGVDQTVNFADLFTAVDGAIIKTAEVTVTDGTYADGVITVPGKAGTYTVTVTDNFYCNTATATIVVNDAVSVDKFTGKAVTLTHTVESIDGGKVTADLVDLFDAVGPVIMSQDVTVTVDGATVNKVASDWTQTTVDFTTPGEYTVTITDNYYCNIATATVTVAEPANVDKFIGKDIEVTHTLATIESNVYTVDFADLFDTNGYAVKDITVTGGTYADGKVTVEGLGTITVTATDNFYCNVATATITVKEPANVDKFIGKTVTLTHTLDTIENGVVTATLDDLFTMVDPTLVKPEGLTVGGDGTHNEGIVSFAGTGTFTVTITDNFYCNTATATVVVNAPAAVDKFIGKDIEVTHTLETIESGKYTVNFADLFDTTGYEVKDITVTGATYADGKVTVEGLGTITVTATDNFYCNIATATITVKEPANQTKWTATNKTIDLTVNTVGVAQTVNFADLFTAVSGAVIKSAEVTVTDGTYADGVITVPGKAGTYTVTVTDNFYCNPVTATITVNDAAKVDKFTGKEVTYTHTLATIEGNTATFNFADLFTTNTAYPVKDITVTGATYADGKITVTGIGTFTVTATDNFYCNTATATVTVKEPANVDKWTATNKTIDLTVNTVGQNQTVNFADLFTAVSGAVIKSAEVTVTDGTYADGVITVPGKAGTYTVTVTDNFYCNPVTATITVNDAANVDKFTGKTVSKKLAYGSDTTTVTLGDLFTAGSYTIKDVTVTGGTYAKGATWDKGTVTVTGTGTFTITITDNYYCNTAKATLTVAAADPINKFTAKNPTITHTLASIDAKEVSVKLGDIFSGTNVVTGNITVTIAGTTTTVTAADWANATVTVPGTTGDVTVTINDNNTCITATGKVTLKAPADVTKWTATNQTVQLTLNNAGQSQTLKFSELFTAVSGAYIKTPVVTVSGGGSYVNNAINVPGVAGTYTVTVTDNFYCNATTATVTVINPANVTKWTAKTGLAYEVEAGASKTLTLADIFTLNNNYKVGTVTYNVEGEGDKTVSGSEWATTQINFTAGTYTVTITDDLFSDGVYTAEVKVTEKVVEPVQKFTVKDSYYLVAHDVVDPGSSDVKTITLGDIFAASGEGTINSANVTVTTSDKVRNIEATITQNASDWTQTTIALKYSGEITLTITDGADCVAASAIVATAPKWVGDVDAGDASTIAQAHYGTKTRTYNINVTVQPGSTGTFTLTGIPADGVYGIQWQNGYGIYGTTGIGEFSVNGYKDTSTVESPKWSDAVGADFLAYLTAGSNTFTVTNVGSQPLSVYGNVNAMSLDKSGYDDEDFLPYLKDNSDGETGGGTVTPPEDTEWPVPELTWSGKFSGHQYFGDYYGNSIVSPLVNGTYAAGAYTVHTITIPDSGYEGVYVLQFKTTSEAAKIKATTADGYYADFNLTEDGWSSSCAQDQLIYLKKGVNTIYVQNVGDASFVLTDIDIGYFKSGYETYYMYDVAQKADGTIPN